MSDELVQQGQEKKEERVDELDLIGALLLKLLQKIINSLKSNKNS